MPATHMPTTTLVTFEVGGADRLEASHLNLPTAREWLSETEPGTLGLLLEPEKALAEDTERAAEIARQGGFPFNAQGRYPALVWMLVYP